MIGGIGYAQMAWGLAQSRVFSGVAYPPWKVPQPREQAGGWACSREYYRIIDRAWELVKGRKVRRGYTLDHGCRNKACWRPSHMTEMTRAANTAKGNRDNPRSTVAARAARRRAGIVAQSNEIERQLGTVTPITDDERRGA